MNGCIKYQKNNSKLVEFRGLGVSNIESITAHTTRENTDET